MNTNLNGALAELQAHLDRLTQERDARGALVDQIRGALNCKPGDDVVAKARDEYAMHGFWIDEANKRQDECDALRAAAAQSQTIKDSLYAEVAKLKADLAARPVVESKEARAVREACGSRTGGIVYTVHGEVRISAGEKDEAVADALRRFLASAPPVAAPAPVSEMTPTKFHGISFGEWLELLCTLKRFSSALPTETMSLTAMFERAAHAYVRSTMKDPAPSERAVDRELRAAVEAESKDWINPRMWGGAGNKRIIAALSAWLSAPLAAPDECDDGSKIVRFKLGPDGTLTNMDDVSFTLNLHDALDAPRAGLRLDPDAEQDEYVSAAVAYAEALAEDGPSPVNETARVFKALYDARKRSAPAPDGTLHDRIHETSGRLIKSTPIRSALDVAARELAEACVASNDEIGWYNGGGPGWRRAYKALHAYKALRNAGGDAAATGTALSVEFETTAMPSELRAECDALRRKIEAAMGIPPAAFPRPAAPPSDDDDDEQPQREADFQRIRAQAFEEVSGARLVAAYRTLCGHSPMGIMSRIELASDIDKLVGLVADRAAPKQPAPPSDDAAKFDPKSATRHPSSLEEKTKQIEARAERDLQDARSDAESVLASVRSALERQIGVQIAAPPSPREKVYVPVFANGCSKLYTEAERAARDSKPDPDYWLAIDAVRVEGK